MESGQQVGKDKRLTDRQGYVSRLISSYRDEAKQLLRDVLRAQNRWSRELEEAVFAGLPGLERPPKTGGHYVRRRLPWRQVERDALKRHLMGLGLGRWREIHAALSNSVRGFKHGPADVEDACWQLLLECQLMLQAPQDRLYLARVLEAVADRGSISTPGAAFTKVQSSAKSIVRRLMLLEELNVLMPSFMRSEAVVGIFRALVQTLPAAGAPAAWWDVEADVALMVGVHRHGYNSFETIRKDPVLQPGFQGYHDDNEHKSKPWSQAASPGTADTTEPLTPQQQATSDVEATISAGFDTPGPVISADGAATRTLPTAAAAAAVAANAWPPVEVLSKRVRLLSDLVAQAVAIAEAHGLLLPATEAAPGPSYEKQGTKVENKLMGILPYAATAAAAAAGTLDWQQPGLLPAADTAAAAASMAAAAGVKPGIVGSSGALDKLSGSISGQLDLDEGEMDDMLGEFASPADKYNPAQQQHDDYRSVEDDDYDEEEEEEEPVDQEGSRAARFGSYFSTGLQHRGRGGRPRKGSQRGSVADSGGDGGDGRRRAHRPSKRYADTVLLELEAGDAAFATAASQGESGAHEVTKKARRELLNLVLAWGPPDATGDAAADLAGAVGADPSAAAVAMAAAGADYDWDAWSGAGGLTGPLQKMSTAELTVMLRELLVEMEELVSAASAAAAAGLNKARNAHQPNCDCVVCTNRRNADQRKREAQGGVEAPADNTEAEEAAAAAAKAAVKPLPKGEVLTSVTAGRLQERIELVAFFRSVVGLVGTGQLEEVFKKGAKDLPSWWTPQLDVGLVVGVVTHGFGEWGPMFEDENLPFKATASAAGVVGYDPNDPAAAAALGDTTTRSSTAKARAGLPDWVPDAKVLIKRCKALVGVIKAKVLGAKGPAAGGQQKGGGPKGFRGDEETPASGGKGKAGKGKASKSAAAIKSGGKGMTGQGSMFVSQLDQPAQLQQFAAMGMLPPSLTASGGGAGGSSSLQQLLAQRFAGGPAAATLQQQQQLLLLQQQQGQQAGGQVLGKRSAAAAGLVHSSQPRRAAAAAALVDSATLAGAVAAADPVLTPSQIAVLEMMPVVTRTDDGQPQLPLVVTDKMTLLALGKIDPTRPAFHTSSQIYPIGLQTAVQYLSAVNQGSSTKYTCVVADGAVAGTSGPVFLVVAADAPGQQWLAQSPQKVWQQIHAQVQQVQQVTLPPLDGLEQFGLSHPLVAMLIQELPGLDQCAGFRASESPAPPQVVTAIRQLQTAMGAVIASRPDEQQQQMLLSSAGGVAAAQPLAVQAATTQQQVLRAQLLQQQVMRMQQAGQMHPNQQPQQLLPQIASNAAPASDGGQQHQPNQQQLLQLLQQQKVMQQNQLLQQHLGAQQLQHRSSGAGDGAAQHQLQRQSAAAAAAAANPAVVQQVLLMQQRQQQLAQQQPAAATAEQAALMQQMAAARAVSAAGTGAGSVIWPQQQQQQMMLTPQQLQQQLLLRQALATGLQPLQQQQQQGGGGAM